MTKTNKKTNIISTPRAARPKILVVLGPTAVGKSDMAVAIARQFNGEIISADSRQVYVGMDIGTGKITKKEMHGIPHHLLDVLSPTAKKRFTVTDFQALAYEAIDDILKRGKLPIVCGGTGFYIQSIVDGTVLPDVPVNPALRKKLTLKSSDALVKILSKLDKNRLKHIHVNNKIRLIRAIEIATMLGKVPPVKKEPRYETLQIGLDVADKDLQSKISKRIAARMKKGMLREAVKLHKAGLSYKKMREFGLEYRHMANLLEKNVSKQEFVALLEFNIRDYARRQRAWFIRDKRIKWFKPTELKAITKEVRKYLL